MNYLEELKKNKSLKYLFVAFALSLLLFVALSIYINKKEIEILPQTGTVEDLIAEEDVLDDLYGERQRQKENMNNLKTLRNGIGFVFLVVVVMIFIASIKKQR